MKKLLLAILILLFLIGYATSVQAFELNFQEKIQPLQPLIQKPLIPKLNFGWLDLLKKYFAPKKTSFFNLFNTNNSDNSKPKISKTKIKKASKTKKKHKNQNKQMKNQKKEKIKYLITSKKQTGKQFLGCELWYEYSSYKIPNFSIKIYNKTLKQTEYEAFFGKVYKAPLNCTLFYEKIEDYCTLKCITSPKNIVLNPPIPYTIDIPDSFLDKVIQKYSLKPDWPDSFPALKINSYQPMRKINN